VGDIDQTLPVRDGDKAAVFSARLADEVT